MRRVSQVRGPLRQRHSEPQPDGTVVIRVCGALKLATSNHVTGKTINYNESSPGTITAYPDGSS